MADNALQSLLGFLTDLEKAGIYFRLDRVRDEAIMVRIDVPGERWEVEFFADGEIEVERFGMTATTKSGVVGKPESDELLRDLLTKYAD